MIFSGDDGMFVRSRQLDQLKDSISDSSIKVIYGVRRGGKTTLLEQFRSYLRRQGIAGERIIYYDFDHAINSHLLDPNTISQEIKKKLTAGKTTFVFLDELEKLPDYSVLIGRLVKMKSVDLYVTSSSMKIKALADMYCCHYIYLGPLSFQEYLVCHHYEATLNNLYHYLNSGGFPFAQDIRSHSSIQNYFEDVINTIIVNSFLQKGALCNPSLARQLAVFLANQTGQFTNVSQAVTALQDNQIKVSNKTLSAYLTLLQDSFLFAPCQELNRRTGKAKTTNVQYFPVDSCLHWILTNHHGALSETNLTTVVFNELRNRGYQVFTACSDRHPVTFIARRNGQQHFFQFNFSILSAAAYQQATDGLRHVPNKYPKTLIIAKPGDLTWTESHEDFKVISLIEWLMEK